MMKVMRRDTMMETGIVLQIAMTTHFTTIILKTIKQDIMMAITLDSATAK
jgi:hypothetical protein